jgi:arylsulfatase A-like enzyme
MTPSGPAALPPRGATTVRRRAGWTALRRTLRLLLAALLLCGCSPASETPPNLLLITLDTTRADHLGAYGAPSDLTPRLDRLAAEGVVFTRAFSTAAVTPVAHASILTGLEPPDHGLRVLSAGSGFRLPEDVSSLATILRTRGWETLAVHSAFPVSEHFGLDQGFTTFESLGGVLHEEPDGSHAFEYEQRRSDETTALAVHHLERAGRPFLLWVHYWDPHDPLRLPPEEDLVGVPRPLSADDPALYAAEVHYMDRQIGALLDALEREGAAEHTVVVVTADHGQGLGEHGWAYHRLLYQEQIDVPLILRVPGGPQGVRVATPASVVDIVPTVLDLLGVDPPSPLDGIDLWPLVTGGAPLARTLYADQLNGYDLNAVMTRARPRDDFLYCVTDGRWKLVYRPAHPRRSELFDLEDDPDESTNLFGTERDVVRRLARELARRHPWVLQAFPSEADLTAEERARVDRSLSALGYVGDAAPSRGPVWAWACLEHPTPLQNEPGRCEACGEPLLPRARRR